MSKDEIKRQAVRSDLYVFATEICGYEEVNLRTHGEMLDALESPNPRKLIVMPRGTFKSSIGTVAYSIWRLINNPNERILIDSEVYTNSKNFLREIRAIFQSKKFVDLFGDWRGSNWTENEITVSTRTKSYKEASITAGGIGTVKVGQHYTVIIGDDYNSGNNSETTEMRAKVVRHYQLNTSILEPTGTYAIIGTRYAVDDVIGWIQANEIGAQDESR